MESVFLVLGGEGAIGDKGASLSTEGIGSLPGSFVRSLGRTIGHLGYVFNRYQPYLIGSHTHFEGYPSRTVLLGVWVSIGASVLVSGPGALVFPSFTREAVFSSTRVL